ANTSPVRFDAKLKESLDPNSLDGRIGDFRPVILPLVEVFSADVGPGTNLFDGAVPILPAEFLDELRARFHRCRRDWLFQPRGDVAVEILKNFQPNDQPRLIEPRKLR